MAAPMIGQPLYGSTAIIAAATNNVPTAYSSAAGSQVFTALKHAAPLTNLKIINTTAGVIAVAITAGSAGSGSAADNLFVNAGESATFQNIALGSSLYIRSVTGSALTTGSVFVSVF